MALPKAPPKPYSQLPKRKKDFIQHYIRSGDALDAYYKAGYAEGRDAKNKCRKYLRELQPYIRTQLDGYIKGTDLAILAVKVVGELATKAESEAVRLNAAKALLDKTLPDDPKEVHHHHTSDTKKMTDDELMQQLKRLQDKLFLDAPQAEVVESAVRETDDET